MIKLPADAQLAWHYTDGDKLRDGRKVPPPGETLIHEGELLLRESGLHASINLLDATIYAAGTTLHRVWVEHFIESTDKLVARHRTILWSVNVEPIFDEVAWYLAKKASTFFYNTPTIQEALLKWTPETRDAAQKEVEKLGEPRQQYRRFLSLTQDLYSFHLLSQYILHAAFSLHTKHGTNFIDDFNMIVSGYYKLYNRYYTTLHKNKTVSRPSDYISTPEELFKFILLKVHEKGATLNQERKDDPGSMGNND